MCGRYELHSQPAAIALAFGLAAPPALQPRYNIAPMQSVPIVRVAANGARECVDVRWGLVPRWAKDPAIGAKMINARGETLAEKPSFKMAFRRHRCLVPADGFYEWQQLPDGRKQPVRITLAAGGPFAFAGLTERWIAPDGAVVDTCTIVTTDANSLLRAVHVRMPVIVPPPDYERWLDPAHEGPQDVIAPYPSEAMAYYPVSTRVNAVRNDDATLIEPQGEEPAKEEPPPRAAPEQESLF